MKVWLWKRLNHLSKQWPPYANDRRKQHLIVRNFLRDLKEAREFEHAHVLIGHGGNVLYTRNANLSGFSEYQAETYRLCGVPVINLMTADYRALCQQVMKGPMVTPDGRLDNPLSLPIAFQHVSLETMARMRQSIGATIHNLDLT